MNDATYSSETAPAAGKPYGAMVLLVDDQVMVGEAVRRALADEHDIDFHYCRDPANAMADAERIGPTIILQDLMMPGIDGLTLVRRFRANPSTSEIPIVVLSTTEEPSVKSDAFAFGANDYLIKLPSNIELIARIRYHSKAYLNQVQRDEAYRALRESQRQLTEKNLELQRLTHLDGLTGICNRRHFDEHLQMEWSRALRDQTYLSVLIIDIDDFKPYNDTYGHLGGDEALKQVAKALMMNVARSTDFVARLGGEEFAMVLRTTTLAGTKVMASKVLLAIREMGVVHSKSTVWHSLTVSIGGASMVPQRGQSMLSIIEAADKALYKAKASGKNRAVMHGGGD